MKKPGQCPLLAKCNISNCGKIGIDDFHTVEGWEICVYMCPLEDHCIWDYYKPSDKWILESCFYGMVEWKGGDWVAQDYRQVHTDVCASKHNPYSHHHGLGSLPILLYKYARQL